MCFLRPPQNGAYEPLKDDDYLLEIKIRLAVRNEDATAVIAMDPKWAKDRTEETKLTSAIFSLIEKGLAKHSDLIQVARLNPRRVPSVPEFHDLCE